MLKALPMTCASKYVLCWRMPLWTSLLNVEGWRSKGCDVGLSRSHVIVIPLSTYFARRVHEESKMPSPLGLHLHTFFRLSRPLLFKHHVRVVRSIFKRPCSCTVAFQQEIATAESPKLETIFDSPPKPAADHRELAEAQKLFKVSPYSPGSPLLLPNGAEMLNKLAHFLRSHYPQFGFREVITPTIYKKSLWEKSGHWENYAEDMFEVRGRGLRGQKEDGEIGEDEEFGMKPMNCPGHCLLFASEKRSYRDLPIRFADFGALHRNEISGAISGLTRVRRFHQDDGHIFCRPSQVESEIKKTMDFVDLVYRQVFDLGPYRLVLSTRPKDDYIGAIDEWDSAETQLKTALDHSGLAWSLNEGDGAFYGPKIDIILKDSDGKEHQTATIQLDFQLPQRFGLKYVAQAPDLERKGLVRADTDPKLLEETGNVTPVIIHRAILGSLERFLALLIEHYDGRYPFWISPRPCVVLSVSQAPEQVEYVERVAAQLGGYPASGGKAEKMPMLRMPLHIDTDTSARSLSKKLREARAKGYNMIVVVGPKEVESETVALTIHRQRNAEMAGLLLDRTIGRFDGKQDTKPGQIRRFFETLQDNYL